MTDLPPIDWAFLFTRPRWVFPITRFVQYGPEDEAWARPLGFGYENDPERHERWRFRAVGYAAYPGPSIRFPSSIIYIRPEF